MPGLIVEMKRGGDGFDAAAVFLIKYISTTRLSVALTRMSGGFQFMGNAVCQKPFKTVAIVAAAMSFAAVAAVPEVPEELQGVNAWGGRRPHPAVVNPVGREADENLISLRISPRGRPRRARAISSRRGSISRRIFRKPSP